MLSQLRSLAKSTAIYSLGNISTKVVGLLLLPYFTNLAYLSVEAYGLLGLFEAIVQFFITLFGLGIYNGVFRWFYEDESRQGSLIFTSLLTVCITAGLGLLAGFLYRDFFTQWLFEDPKFIPAYNWMLITGALQLISVLPVTVMRLKNHPKIFSITSIIKLVVTLLLTYVLLVSKSLGLKAIFTALGIAEIIFLIIILPYLWKNMEFKIDWRVPTVLLSYSLPIMLSSLIGILIQFIDRFIINSIQGLAEVGIYSLAVKLTNVIKVFVISTFSLSLTPFLFKKIDEPDHKRFYSKSMTYYGFVILFFIMFISLFSYEVIKVFTGSTVYWQAFWVIPVLSMSLYFVAIRSVGFMGLHISKKMWYLTILTTFILSLNIILNLYLIPIAGTMGAAIATLISQMLYFVIGYRISQKEYFIPFEWGKIAVMPILASVLIYAGILTNSIDVWIRIPLKFTFILLFPVILYLGKFYEEIELNRLKGAFIKWKNPEALLNNLKQFFNDETN